MTDAKENEQQLVTAVAGTSSAASVESPSSGSGDIKKIEFRWTVKRVSDIDTSKQVLCVIFFSYFVFSFSIS